MEVLKHNWDWIAANPWGSLALAFMIFMGGWGLARLFYGERLELLKIKSEKLDPIRKPASSRSYVYKSHGRHGRNALATTTHDAVVGEPMSLAALIPVEGRLHVVLQGPPPASLGEIHAAWHYSIAGVTNWTASRYQESTNAPTQHFNAEEGVADLHIEFARAGYVTIEAFEGDQRSVTWTKRLHVLPPRSL